MMNTNNEACHYGMWLLKARKSEHRATASKTRKGIIAQARCAVVTVTTSFVCWFSAHLL
jgi:hypothetical protein